MKSIFKRILISSLFASSVAFVFSQEALKSTEEEYYDFLSLQGLVNRPTLNYRTLSDSEWELSEEARNDERNVWKNNNLGTKHSVSDNVAFKIYGPEWFNSYNTAAPYGQNDGALWQGKGYNTSFTAGARLEAYGFELTFKPQVSFSENKDFDIMTSNTDSEYGYFWGYSKNVGVDLPQRFGNSSFATFDWGDTEIRYTWKTLTVGFGTQAIWLGPATFNPMLSSNNAATYPKVDFGIRKTPVTLFGWYAGDIEGRVWAGYLSESDYFDNDSSNDHNMINGIAVAYAPSFLAGLTLSINKICLCKWKDKSLKYFNPLYDSNEEEDQKASFGIDWIFPQVGFEVYGELGIDDYANFDTFIERTLIYTVGLKKNVTISKKYNIRGKLYFEWNNSEMSQDFQFQWPYNFGFHHQITQGYTNKGQWIGSGIGYGGNNQILGLTIYHSNGFIDFFIQRGNPDINYLYSKAVDSKASDHVLDGFPVKFYSNIGLTNLNYITKNILISETFVYNKTRRPQYENNGVIRNYCFNLTIKYNF